MHKSLLSVIKSFEFIIAIIPGTGNVIFIVHDSPDLDSSYCNPLYKVTNFYAICKSKLVT